MAAPRAILFANNRREWHAQQLCRAWRARGLRVTVSSLSQSRFSPDGPTIAAPNVGPDSPSPLRGAFVRGIGAGSLEQITFRLSILHALEKQGVIVMNSPRSIERTVDKGMCSFLLRHARLPGAPAWVCHDRGQARTILERELAAGRFLVSKPLFGSRGTDVTLLRRCEDLPKADTVNGVWYLQRFIDTADANGHYRDRRAFVVGGRCIAVMERYARHWVVNVHRGGRCRKVPIDPLQADIAVGAARAVGAEYAGVDLIVDRDDRTHILEVNGIPAWQGLEESCRPNVAEIIARHTEQRWKLDR